MVGAVYDMLGTQEDKRGKAEVAFVFMYFCIFLFSYFLNLYFLEFVFSYFYISTLDICVIFVLIFLYFFVFVHRSHCDINLSFFGIINYNENDEGSLLLLAFTQTTFQELFSKMDQNADG